MKTAISTLLALWIAGFTASASANIQSYTHYTDFVTATSQQSTISNALDSFTQLTPISSGDTYAGITYSFDIKDAANPNAPHGTVGQVQPASAAGYLPILAKPGNGVSFQPGDSVTLSFSAPISSFGVTLGIAPLSSFEIWNGNGTNLLASTSGFTSYGEQTALYAGFFLGLVSDTPFSSVILKGGYRYMARQGNVPWSGWVVDRVTYGTISAVPVPAAWMLFLGGMPLLLNAFRKKA